jgi:glycosyltransferase involved in cell wall biosynthesis
MTMNQPAPRLPVSVCLIAGNESARIRRTLESVAEWTSEIVVVLNDDVADGTDKIALEFGAHVFREPWKGHVAQKNSAVEKAAQEWILGLDADEVISPELAVEIRQLFAATEKLKMFAAFSFPRCSIFCGRWIRHGDWYPDRQTRLWRRGRARWGGIDPHDKLVVEGSVGKLGADLKHYTSESINGRLKKIIPFSDEFVRQHDSGGSKTGMLQLAVRPVWRFARAYFLRLGFLDGWQGYYIAWHNAFATLARYAKVREARSHKESTG